MSFAAAGSTASKGNACLTTADQILWEQRVHKENKVNGKFNPDGFSMRASVSSMDVPAKFKPGHCNPNHAALASGFDPTTVGWDPKGPLVKELTDLLAQQVSMPRQRRLLPETTKDSADWPNFPEQARTFPTHIARTTMAGALPKWQYGWVVKSDAESWNKAVAKDRADKTPVRPPAPLAPFASITGAAREAARAKMEAEDRSVCSRGASGSKTPASLSRSASQPASVVHSTLSRQPVDHSRMRGQAGSMEDSIDRKLEVVRPYLTGGEKAKKWYRPLGSTDATDFADHYTKTFGSGLYQRKK